MTAKRSYLVVKETQSKKVHPTEIHKSFDSALDAECEMKRLNKISLFGDRWTVVSVEKGEGHGQHNERELIRTSCL